MSLRLSKRTAPRKASLDDALEIDGLFLRHFIIGALARTEWTKTALSDAFVLLREQAEWGARRAVLHFEKAEKRGEDLRLPLALLVVCPCWRPSLLCNVADALWMGSRALLSEEMKLLRLYRLHARIGDFPP